MGSSAGTTTTPLALRSSSFRLAHARPCIAACVARPAKRRAHAVDSGGGSARDADGAVAAAAVPPLPPASPPPLPSAYASVAPLSADRRAQDAAAARELAARTRAQLAARLIDAAEAEKRGPATATTTRARRRPPRSDPGLPTPNSTPDAQAAVAAAVPALLGRPSPRRRNNQEDEEEELQRQRLAPHLPAAARLAAATLAERNRQRKQEEAEEEQRQVHQGRGRPKPRGVAATTLHLRHHPHSRRPPPPPAPRDPDALLAAVRAAPPPPNRIAVFKGGGYRYDALEQSIRLAGIDHVFRMTNLALKARCVLSAERWGASSPSPGRRANLAQHRALAAARRIPLFVVPGSGDDVDARALCWAARAMLVAKGVLAPAEGETRAEVESEVAAAVPPQAASSSSGRAGGRPVGFRMPIESRSKG